MKWFAAMCEFSDHQREDGCPDMVKVEAIFRVDQVKSVFARNIDLDDLSFHGIEIIFMDGKTIMTETYDLHGFCLNVLEDDAITDILT